MEQYRVQVLGRDLEPLLSIRFFFLESGISCYSTAPN